MNKITLGISSCLLGNNVRYDGGHKLDHFLVDTLGQYVDWVPVCPEVECGFGIPREPLRLVGSVDSPRLVTVRTGQDLTERILRWAKDRVRELESENLCGFIFKSGSPSSGMERVKIYDEHGVPAKNAIGLFARAFMEHFPLLPVEVARCRHALVQADAFAWLAENPKRKFDLIVFDPPSLAKREAERAGAIRAYARLADSGIKHLSPKGILLACSCSAHLSAEEFFGAVRQAASKSDRRFTVLQTTRHAPDHPATFKEADYLKAIYVEFG